ncbi:homeobox-DDT domain protein RLT3 [Impatiens glandulifera]|uniref:homeobox-DDT domain protein RLT3 n=1 Tax=Impatiens glandulifera TaxID=253017 RepID=UPI001FB09AE9|nr:homeobox-DDT domain protein RLT3 [Impatiens glandulifera]
MAGNWKNRTDKGGVVGRKEKKIEEPLSRCVRPHDELFSSDYILKKVFRKDGPPLGVEFDSPSSSAFELREKVVLESDFQACHGSQIAVVESGASGCSQRSCDNTDRSFNRRKVGNPNISRGQVCDNIDMPIKKHGIGKGLMAVWKAVNPDGGDFPGLFSLNKSEFNVGKQMSTSVCQKKNIHEKNLQKQKPAKRKRGKGTALKNKRKDPISRTKAQDNKTEKSKAPRKQKCGLSLEGLRCDYDQGQCPMLVEDEELELRELQAGPNPLTCRAHFSTNGMHGCSLCKDRLAKFPPSSVMMRPPFLVQPWVSSPELVKKLFKVLHFLYTYAVMIDTSSFTLDELAQALVDKDSILLGKIHVSLLKFLLSDVEIDISRKFPAHASKNCNFMKLLHWAEHRESILHFWKKSLNSLTWIEILQQVFVAAGFGSKRGPICMDAVNKEDYVMFQHGLSPGTLKGELFDILSKQGNNGTKVYDLARNPRIVDLNLAATIDELENLISVMLSSDISLFEKISYAAYRLRNTSVGKDDESDQLYMEDFGCVDDETCSSSDDSDHESEASGARALVRKGMFESRKQLSKVSIEIDESHPGEIWLLGLMEGEYSDLSIEEKLSTLVSLIDLVSAGSSIRKEGSVMYAAKSASRVASYGSGAKIKRSSRHDNNPMFGSQNSAFPVIRGDHTELGVLPIDSSVDSVRTCSETQNLVELHPMQSIFLGSDRRYNRYWLFLGPCSTIDPGHKRIYFESSDDGHWEVINTEEALCMFLSTLDCRGVREAHLLSSLRKREAFLYQKMYSTINDTGNRLLLQSDQSDLTMSREDSSSMISDADNNISLSETMNDLAAPSGSRFLGTGYKERQKPNLCQSQAFDSWIWSTFYCDLNAVKYGCRSFLDSLTHCVCCHDLYWRDEKHCKTCHITFELDFDLEEKYVVHAATCREKEDTCMFPKHKVLSPTLQALKAAAYAIESVMPEGALVGAWTKSGHKLWIKRLRRTSTLTEFLQVLADFVDAINEEWPNQCNVEDMPSNMTLEEIIACFKTLSCTTSAIALWLVKLDTFIAPKLKSVYSERKTRLSCKSGRSARAHNS